MKVRELDREQLQQLKQNYLTHVVNKDEGTTYYDLSEADSLVKDEEVFSYYENTEFSEDDFL